MAEDEVIPESSSMAEELLNVLNPHPYNKVVSNLSKKCCVDPRVFNRTRLAKNYWVDTKRFLSGTNRILPHGIFELFGEYSGEDGATVRDNMIGWTYDNFCQIETCTGIALQQRKTDLKSYLENIRDERNPGDEISIYILACMYRRHVFIYTKDWWWTTVMFVMPIDEKDVIVKCDLVLVYISPGIYGEVKGIRAPALSETPSIKAHNTSSDTVKSVDTTEGHNKSLEFVTKPVMSGPSKVAATQRIRQSRAKNSAPTTSKPRRSPRKCKVMSYKDFVSGLEGMDNQTSPKKKRPKVGLKQPSRARIASQKKIQSARTLRLCSPPPPTRVTKAATPEKPPKDVGEPTLTPLNKSALLETETQPVPNPDKEMSEAANTLLSLSGDTDKTTTEIEDLPILESTADETEETGRPPVALEVNVVISETNDGNIKREQVIGSAIKEEASKHSGDQEYQPTASTSNKLAKKSTTRQFSMKSYRLKRKPQIKRRFKCRICPEILNSVHDYNFHYREKHPPLPCPYCTRSFNAPRYLSRHMYNHAESMYECDKCDKGFAFESQYTTHKRRHIKDNDFVCMKVNCGKRFKRDSELKAHVKTHRKTNIKCGHKDCTYSNKDIRNVRAHRKRHSDDKPYKCVNCGAGFKWQQQKKRHLVNCQ